MVRPRNKPSQSGQLIPHKDAIQRGKDGLFKMLKKLDTHSQKWNWTLTLYHIQKLTQSASHTKINSKCINDLSLRAKNITLLDKNIGDIFMTVDLTTVFLNYDTKTQATVKTDELDFIKTASKVTINSEKKTHIMGEHICKSYIW